MKHVEASHGYRPVDVTICIATYGNTSWIKLAEERALLSAMDQSVECQIIMAHDSVSLAEARNTAAQEAKTEFLIFLDADDELDPEYVEHMLEGTADIRRPSTVGFVNGIQQGDPDLIPERNILRANYVIIGAMCRREMFLAVNGFRELPILEDWDLWLRMFLYGAVIEAIPKAVYRIHISKNSRNQDQRLLRETYDDIRRRYGQ